MKRLVLVLLLLSVPLTLPRSAHAGAVTYDLAGALRAASSTITVPPEWDGIWTTQDSVYDCTTGFKSFTTGTDTLCANQVFNGNTGSNPFTFTCTGTADATTLHATCTGTGQVFTDCQVTIDLQIDVVRTNDTYRSVATVNTSYSGTGTGCDLLPPSCTRTVSYGTRTGPAPTAYCETPARQTTWGRLKVTYR